VHTDSLSCTPLFVPTVLPIQVSFTPKNVETGQVLEDDAVIMLEKFRMNAQDEAVKNSMIVESPGIVVLLWDNTYSWLTGKTLSYSVKLILPKETSEDLGQHEFFTRKLQECTSKASTLQREYQDLQGTSSLLSTEITGLEAQVSTYRFLFPHCFFLLSACPARVFSC
jgi:hypothetical protein